MRLSVILFLLVGVGMAAFGQTNAPQAIVSPTNAPATRKMSLEDCIEIALQHNLDVQIKRYNPEILGYNLFAVYSAYEPSLSMSGGHDYSTSSGGVDQYGRPFGSTETEDNHFSTAVGGMLPWGTTYSLGGSVTDTYGTRPSTIFNQNSPVLVTNTFFDPNTGAPHSFVSTNFASIPSRASFENVQGNAGALQLRQPLLRNFLFDNTRLQIILDKKNLKTSQEDLRLQIMTTVTAVETAYFNLIFARENVKVQQKALEMAETQLANDTKRVEVGALAPLSERQSQSQAAASRVAVLSALSTQDTLLRVLKNLLSDDYSKWQDVTIDPAEALLAMPQTFNLQESWRRGLTMRPDLIEQKLSLEAQGYVVKYQRNQLLPQLDVVGTAGYAASGKDLNDAADQIRGRDNPFWSGALQMTMPLGNTLARNNYKAAKSTKEQIAAQLKQLEQSILINIENAIAVAKTDFEQVSATREARLYAEEALAAEEKKLESGKSTTFDVLSLQSKLTSARSDEISALRQYNNDLAQLALAEGSTLERRHVKIMPKNDK